MAYQIDEGSRERRDFVCDCCNTEALRTWADVRGEDGSMAVYYASCYRHDGMQEAWIDAILGNWDDDPTDDHITFSCRVGPVEGSDAPAATLVDGGEVAPDSPIFGRKLSRDEGLAHPRVDEFWAIVDTILENDDLVRRHVYGQ